MPYALIAIGLVMVITAIQNTYAQFGAQVKSDGVDFTKFMIAIGMVGAAGYVPELRNLSRLFMFLILLAMILTNSRTGRGFFGNFLDAINQGPAGVVPGGSPSTTIPNAGNILQPNPAPADPGSNTPSFFESLRQPGGGGFWNWSGFPSPF